MGYKICGYCFLNLVENKSTLCINISHDYLEIIRLSAKDYDYVKKLFLEIHTSGIEHQFHPHPFDKTTAQLICMYEGIDWYAGAFLHKSDEKRLVGYAMLRGWDDGYEIPSFGICVLPKYHNLGIGSLLLDIAILVAKLRLSPAIRLKVYPDNVSALKLYKKRGFQFFAIAEDNQLVGHLSLRNE